MHNSDELILVVLQLGLRQTELCSILISFHRLIQLPVVVPLAAIEQVGLVCLGQVLLVGLLVDALEEELAQLVAAGAAWCAH